MFNPSREEVRRFFCEAWQKRVAGNVLTPLEAIAVDWIDQDGFGRMPVANIAGLPRAAEHPPQQHAPHIGEDGPTILSELGYSGSEIDAMFKRGGVCAPAPKAKAAE